MNSRFDSFVIFAEMRTGSNFLEANLNALSGVVCHGEAFNPHFIGYPKNAPILGIDLEARNAAPKRLLEAIQADRDLIGGFRYFHDHDPRVFDAVMDDPRCAKIILTRNPVDSYVSWKIAQATGQWKLGDLGALKSAKARFEAEEFRAHVDALQAFQLRLLNRLQVSGQTAFYVAYEDIQNLDVINGLAQFLGVDARLDALDTGLKKQNPSPLSDKVENYEGMAAALKSFDRFDLDRTPNFEPRRGPNVPSYVAAAETPLLYLPLRGALQPEIIEWLAALDGVAADALSSKMTQKDLRRWKRQRPGHRSFTVLHHPVVRAHDVFCRFILPTGKGNYRELRETLISSYHVPLPKDGPDGSFDLDQYRDAFSEFLVFLKGNLTGQTSLRVDAAWCSQAQAVAGFAEFCLPDRLIRAADLAEELAELARSVGVATPPKVPRAKKHGPFDLARVYTPEIEALTAAAYPRDYLMFGFGAWNDTDENTD